MRRLPETRRAPLRPGLTLRPNHNAYSEQEKTEGTERTPQFSLFPPVGHRDIGPLPYAQILLARLGPAC